MLEAIQKYVDFTIKTLQEDATSKGQKIPALRGEATETTGKVISSDYFKYLVTGRPPGKQPPPEKMLDFVQKNQQILQDARKTFKNISENSLAFLIGRKIGRDGSDIYQGKKPGIDLLGSMDKGMEDLLRAIGRGEAIKFVTALRNELNSK